MQSTSATTLVFSSILLLLRLLRPSLSSPVPTSTPKFPNEALPTKSGYLPVSSGTNSAIFFTFYEAQNSTLPHSQTPLLIWLQGGPGCSSMIGNFFELGPYLVVRSESQNVVLEPNLGSWNRLCGLIFLDNPIGTGFSIASKPQEIPRDQNSVAKHLFAAITEFLGLDSAFKNRPLYIAGESYAGKYVPAIGYYILKRNMKLPAPKKMNLKGVAIGNGLTDPVTQVKTHAMNSYFSGLINKRQKDELEKAQQKAVQLVKMGNWSEATDARNAALNLLQNMTGLATLYDYRKLEPYELRFVSKFLQSEEVKKALGANESIEFEDCSDLVEAALHEDVMKSVKYMVEFLVKKSKVLLYQGFFDLRDGVVSTEAWIKTMKWEEIDRFLTADRKVWKVNGVRAGYVQKWENLSQVVVLEAGHLVPADQALNSQAMIEDWVLERGQFANDQKKDPTSNVSGYP